MKNIQFILITFLGFCAFPCQEPIPGQLKVEGGTIQGTDGGFDYI